MAELWTGAVKGRSRLLGWLFGKSSPTQRREAALTGLRRAPSSYAALSYHTQTVRFWVDRRGLRRLVRYRIVPADPEPVEPGLISVSELADRGRLPSDSRSPDYLRREIRRPVAAGVAGALNAARIYYSGWDFSKRSLEADLESRGLDGAGVLPHYYYRDDARRLAAAIDPFVESMLRLWYRTDQEVAEDYELQGFLSACASKDGGDIPGFPARMTTQQELFRLIADLVFRAGPQHAAVNNGQFDAYGRIPGKMAVAFPSDHASFTEADLWEAMPDTETSIGQMGMVWVLSRPTIRSILHAGEAPAFHPKLCFEADDIIGAFRRRLSMVSSDIQARNERLEQPYVYLDPLNVSRSTDI